MKNYILPLLILAALGACQDENEIQYSINPELQPYVDIFYSEAAARGAEIPKNLVADFKQEIQGITKGDKIQGQNYLYVRPELFAGFNENQREAYTIYSLAKLFLEISQPCIDVDYNNPATPCETEINNYEREATFNSFFE
jgi:hypothetical protein